jgi:nitric oxide synthase-interacting protein
MQVDNCRASNLTASQDAGQKVTGKDVVRLVGGGTGFAGKEGQKLQSERQYTLGPGTGREDMRGQAAAGASRFGLAFQN